jgi:hypothetical protein
LLIQLCTVHNTTNNKSFPFRHTHESALHTLKTADLLFLIREKKNIKKNYVLKVLWKCSQV